MRRFSILLPLLVLAGCGGSREDKVVGTWKVDPASISSSRLSADAKSKPEWTDGVAALGKVRLIFNRNPQTVAASGLGQRAEGKWRMLMTEVAIESSEPGWPVLTLDQQNSAIHAVLRRDNDVVTFNLVKE